MKTFERNDFSVFSRVFFFCFFFFVSGHILYYLVKLTWAYSQNEWGRGRSRPTSSRQRISHVGLLPEIEAATAQKGSKVKLFQLQQLQVQHLQLSFRIFFSIIIFVGSILDKMLKLSPRWGEGVVNKSHEIFTRQAFKILLIIVCSSHG